jgi:hypothetical protein
MPRVVLRRMRVRIKKHPFSGDCPDGPDIGTRIYRFTKLLVAPSVKLSRHWCCETDGDCDFWSGQTKNSDPAFSLLARVAQPDSRRYRRPRLANHTFLAVCHSWWPKMGIKLIWFLPVRPGF